MALYAAAAAGGGTVQWLIDAANAVAGLEPRARRGARTEDLWYQEAEVRGGPPREESREPWSQLAMSTMGFALPLVVQAGQRLLSWLCGRARGREERLRRLQELDALAREVIVAGPGAAAVIATDQGIRAHELIAWAESWTATTQGPLTFARIAQPENAPAR